MPIRTYDHFDLIDVINGYVTIPTPVGVVITPSFTNFGSWSIAGFGAGVVSGISFFDLESGDGNYVVTANVDFTRFPTIPADAKITKIVTELTFNNLIDVEVLATSVQLYSAAVAAFSPASAAQAALLPFAASGFVSGSGIYNHSASETSSDVKDAAYFMSIFGTPYITYAQLIANFTAIANSAQFSTLRSAATAVTGAGDATGHVNFSVAITSWSMAITYDESHMFDLTIDTPSPVKISNPVTITNVGTGSLRNVTEITLTPSDPTYPPIVLDPMLYTIIWTTTTITFWLPFELSDFAGDITISVTIDSFAFSGSILLGTLTVFFEDGSGVYTIAPNTRKDIIYSAVRNGTTFESPIPIPSAKTAYLGGGD